MKTHKASPNKLMPASFLARIMAKKKPKGGK